MVAVTWAAAILCTDDDLRSLEPNVLQWLAADGSGAAMRASAKDQIADELRQSFKNIELATDATEVLDLVLDTTPLKYTAVYLTLHLICNSCSVGGDQWERKAEMYWGKYKEALPGAIGMLTLDINQSGTVDTGEKYYVSQGVRMTRGSARE